MTFALAMGYDWLYEKLDDPSRTEIRDAIINKGVNLPFTSKHKGWVKATNNWGQVCHGGLTAGALAVLEDEPDSPELFWFASRFQRPDWLLGEPAIWERNLARAKTSSAASDSDRLLPLARLWMNAGAGKSEHAMPLHWQSEGDVPIAIHRNSWSDEDAMFVGIKAGSPSANHGQMDTGSFVLDADGLRWTTDLGAEGYHGIESRGMNLWSNAQGSDRWTIFRQQNHGHNTLVIDEQLQVASGHAKIIKFSDAQAFPHSVIDLTPVYSGQAKSVLRGIALLPSGEVLIQDELEGLKPGSRVRWGMITTGMPGNPDKPVIELRQSEKSLALAIHSPDKDLTWKLIDTAKPRHEWDSPNPGTHCANLYRPPHTSATTQPEDFPHLPPHESPALINFAL